MVDGIEEVKEEEEEEEEVKRKTQAVLLEKTLFAHLSILLPHECHCQALSLASSSFG